MELPKNIVQIGSPDKHCKIFVEDYVISYIKQINRSLKGGQSGIALYGKKYAEEDIRYYFLYGASEIKGLEKKGIYLSNLDKEQIENTRMEFFEDEEFVAWCTLSGEMPDGFYILEQGKGLLVNGYATFFEKNDNMLNFMVIVGNRENNRNEAPAETVTSTDGSADYDWGRLAEGGNIDHRLLERTQKLSEIRQSRENRSHSAVTHRRIDKYERKGTWKTLLTGVAVAVCVIGIAVLSDEEKMQDLQAAARQIMANISEQKLPDAEGEVINNIEGQAESFPVTAQEIPETVSEETSPEKVLETVANAEADSQSLADMEPDDEAADAEVVQSVETPQPVLETVKTTVTYVVEKGDMLLTICRERYGSDERVNEICELNGIEDPDDIKVGQIILLPE